MGLFVGVQIPIAKGTHRSKTIKGIKSLRLDLKQQLQEIMFDHEQDIREWFYAQKQTTPKSWRNDPNYFSGYIFTNEPKMTYFGEKSGLIKRFFVDWNSFNVRFEK